MTEGGIKLKNDYIQFHTNAGKGIVMTKKQPITGQQGIFLSFSTNEEVIDFYKKLGDFIEKNCR